MTDDRAQTLGLVLAGGQARRMGGVDKAMIALGGRPLLAHVCARLAPQCGALALNANGDAARFAAFGLPVVADDVAGFAGPLAGVRAGLVFARDNGFKFVVTLPVDTPFAPADLVARLHAARRAGDAVLAVAASGGHRHHVAALWPVDIADAIRQALAVEGERGVGRFCARYAAGVAEWPVAPVDPFFNVNTPADVATAEGFLHAE